jgi:hypothetical protein
LVKLVSTTTWSKRDVMQAEANRTMII